MGTLDIKPLGASFGAEIGGIDVRAMDRDTDTMLMHAIAEHRVLVIRGQSLSPDEQTTFSRRFGPLVALPYIKPIASHPEVIAVLKEADEVKVSTFGSWGMPISAISRSRRSTRSCTRSNCRPKAATRCSPISAPPMTHCRPA